MSHSEHSEHYDAIVVGAGQAGVPLSAALAQAGRRTAVIERDQVGGTCVNRGCTPTKTMVASAEVAQHVRRAAEYGVHSAAPSVDMTEVLRRKQRVVEDSRQGNERRIRSAGAELIYGKASFVAPYTLEVCLRERDGASGEMRTRRLTADRIFLNTGTRPALPPLPGLDQVPVLDSTGIMDLKIVPEHLLVLGGGYVGLEFGQMFRRFGSQVTIVQRGPRLLDREDPDVADEVAKILRKDGIDVLLNAQGRSVSRAGQQIELAVQTEDGNRQLTGSHLLAATGRAPNTGDLNLGATGLEADRHGFIPVNQQLETKVPGIYALGDIKGGPAFTHTSYDDFRIVRANLLGGGARSVDDRPVPYTVFIDPQLGRVGLSEEQAQAEGRDYRVAKIPMGWVARAIETGQTEGFMKALIDPKTEQILGCAVLATQGGELMAMLEIAMLASLPYTALRDAVFAHPTLAESLNTLFTNLQE
jgi:pyruvate/2-oxoglutarate dehydrogenase complex dihydrolipoamide dehydrogenase (E3) component